MDLWRLAKTLPVGSSIELKMDNRPYATRPHLWVWIGSTCSSGNVELDDSLDDLAVSIPQRERERKIAEARAILAKEAEVTAAEKAGLGMSHE